MEQWVPVRGHPTYEVSNYGRVRNTETSVTLGARLNRRGGYLRVRLDGRERYVHRLVYESFHDIDTTGMKIKHSDGDKLNNNLANLVVNIGQKK